MSSTLHILRIIHDREEVKLISKGFSFENMIEQSYNDSDDMKEIEKQKGFLIADYQIKV